MIFLKNLSIYTGKADAFQGSILMQDGKIKAIGQELTPPPQAEIIDLTGQIATPGFIDAHTHVGISEAGLGWEGQDYNEAVNPITPALRAIDGINPAEKSFELARKNGITTLMSAPGSANVVGGETAVIKTKGKTVEEMILRAPCGMKAALGENPKRVYGKMRKPESSPSTRMATAFLLRKLLFETQEYIYKRNQDPEKNRPDIELLGMVKVLKKEMPLRIHAHRADDILTALRIAEEFDIDLTIEHCTEGHKVSEELKQSGFPCIVGPTLVVPSKIELKDKTWETPKILSQAGVKFAIMTDHPVIPIEALPICAALAIKAGLPMLEALKAITINAAEILGVDKRVGSLEIGKDADLVVWNTNPFDIQAQPSYVFINGEEVE